MKKTITLLLITLSSYMLFAQETETTKTKETEVKAYQEIDTPPIYPGCEGNPKSNTCFYRAIQRHIGRKFDTGLANELGLESGRKRILVFIYNK